MARYHSDFALNFVSHCDNLLQSILQLCPTPPPTPDTPAPLVNSTGACTANYTCLESQDFGLSNQTGYRVDLNLETLNTNSAPAYSNALFIWENIIVGDVPDVSTVMDNIDDCARPRPALIDDLYICGRDVAIDGVGDGESCILIIGIAQN